MAKISGINSAKRIVIKLGSSVILRKSGRIAAACLESLAGQIAGLCGKKEIIIVSSGAIGLGKICLKVSKPGDLAEKQALAAVGQARLIQLYQELFSKYNIRIGQVLLTKEDLGDRKRYRNTRNTILTLLGHGVMPVINENDTVAVDEIKFGDNDTLSALVAVKMGADLLVILSDVEGLKDFRNGGRIVREVRSLGSGIEAMVKDDRSVFGVGGFATKIKAAGITMKAGITMVVAKGDEKDVLLKLGKREAGTWFIPSGK